MFGYRPAIEVNFLLKSFYILATCLKKNMVMLWIFFRLFLAKFLKYSKKYYFEKGNFQQNICFG